MMNTREKKSFISLIIFAVFLIIVSHFAVDSLIGTSTLCLLGTVVYGVNVLIAYFYKKSLFNKYQLILLLFFMFQYGQFFLQGLNVPYYDLYYGMFAESAIRFSVVYFYVSITIFNIGIMIGDKFVSKLTEKINIDKNIDESRVEKIYFYIFLAISLIAVSIGIIKFYKSCKYGYANYDDNFGTIFSFVEFYFVPIGLISLIYSNSKKNKKIIALLVIAWGILYTLAGIRTSGIAALLILFIYMMDQRNSKFKIKNILYMALIGLFVLFLINFIATYRNIDNKEHSFFKILLISLKDNFLVSAIGEVGFSNYALPMTKQVIDNDGQFFYGLSYIASIIGMLPSSLDVFGLVTPFVKKYAILDGWLTSKYTFSFGLGFSLCAETYLNFGLFGNLFFIVLGIIFGCFITNIDNEKEPKKFNKYVAYAMLFANFTVFRRMSYTLFKNMFYIIICIGISTLVIGYKKKRGEEHE